MRLLLVGHRGTGKTSLLKRIKHYYQEAKRELMVIDLDKWVEMQKGQTVQSLFRRVGEEGFRQVEKKALEQIEQEFQNAQTDIVVAAGAGFEGPPPSHWRVLWVRRSTDQVGRIFTDRPRLNPAVTPLTEYHERLPARENRYRAWAADTYTVSEGFDEPNEVEARYFFDRLENIGGALTLLPENFLGGEERLASFLKRRLAWGISYIELRDDLLSAEQIRQAIRNLPVDRVLFSFRNPECKRETAEIVKQGKFAFDWPAEWGRSTVGVPTFYSLHQPLSEGSLEETLARFAEFQDGSTKLKAALQINTFNELAAGHEWMKKGGGSRSFLPSSDNGKWGWYRLAMKHEMPLNFLREGKGSSIDQPTVWEWCRITNPVGKFAAVLGHPVAHSRTPAEHFDFFTKRSMPVLAIDIMPEEWNEGALEFLQGLGLRNAAVTAPLKEPAFQKCTWVSDEAKKLEAVNTLLWDEKTRQWRGTNTDLHGLRVVLRSTELQEFKQTSVAVWGGGGTLTSLREALAHEGFTNVRYFSAQTGKERMPLIQERQLQPELVIWAVGRPRLSKDSPWPDNRWNPQVILDLNYSEDSPGREYALKVGAKYLSGLTMFKAQAEHQCSFWS